MTMKCCATTVSLPMFDLEETAELLSRLGYDGAEWRVRRIPEDKRGEPFTPWGNVKNDISPDNLKAEAERIKAVSGKRNLDIVAIAANAPAGDAEQVTLLAEGAAALAGHRGRAAPLVRLGAPDRYYRQANYRRLFEEAAAAFARALEITRANGVRAVIEIHVGTLWESASAACRFVSRFDPADIGVIFDVANMTNRGREDWRLGMEMLGPYLAHVHAGGSRPLAAGDPDETGNVAWKREACSLAAGETDMRDVLECLAAVGYEGYVSVEDFRPIDPEEKLTTELAFLKSIEPE
jgi:sugar phosphate isomerase/epimerase